MDLDWLIKKQDELKGIDISRLRSGNKLKITTINNEYELTVVDGANVWIKGGEYFPKPKLGQMIGSTWGGSSLRLNWIGYGMHMEFVEDSRPTRIIKTSEVRAVTVFGDGWEYNMEWPSHID